MLSTTSGEGQNRMFAQLRATRFKDLPTPLVGDLHYLEQLAVQTSTNIDAWDALALLETVPRGNRRAINKVFFVMAEQMKTGTVLPPEQGSLLAATNNEVERMRTQRLEQLAATFDSANQNARRAYT